MQKKSIFKFLVAWIAVSITSLFFVSWPASGSVRLDVKNHKQERKLSCEAASLVTVLQFHGVQVTEEEVVKRMTFDLTPKRGDEWGDPDVGFVGNIDGIMGETGYAIYWNALARLASEWKKSIVLESGTIEDLVTHLDEKRPVIIWGVKGKGREITWTTPHGKKIFARSNEHTRVVYGYEGKKKKPTAFLLMDPGGRPETLATKTFLKNWDSFGRKGVVVFP